MSSSTDREAPLDDHARELLSAFRAEEILPGEVSDRVLRRLEESGALASPPSAAAPTVVQGRWWIPAGAVALAAAAAVLLWRADMFAATQDDAQHQPVQARDLAEDSHGTPGVSKAGQPPATARSRNPSDVQRAPAAEPGVPVQPEEPLPATSAPLEQPTPARTPERPSPKPNRERRGTATDTPGLAPDPAPNPAPSLAPDAPAAAAASSLAEETRLLGKAQAAVTAKRYRDALKTIASSERRFPKGLLGEERAALRAVALCESDAAGAQRSAAAFAKAHPASALRTRVENACAAD